MYYTRRSAASSGNDASSQQQSSEKSYGGFVKSYIPVFNQSNQGQQPSQNQTPFMKPTETETTSSSSTSVASATPGMHPVVPTTIALNNALKPEICETMLKSEPQAKTDDVANQRKAEQVQKWKEARKKQGTYKVDKKLKKKRLNARLEKVLKPKNAFLIFNELDLKPEYRIQDTMQSTGFGPQKTYTAYLQLNGKTYVGESTNIAGAKMVAADVALKDWFLNSLKKKETETPVDAELKDNESKSMAIDPAPWSSVGSYAMHLLFTRWQMDISNGTAPVAKADKSISASGSIVLSDNSTVVNSANMSLPIMRGSSVSSDSATGGIKKKANRIVSELVDYTVSAIPKLPANCDQYQPLYLFNLAFPGLTFVENIDENLTDERCTLSCKMNGTIYEGKARNKKEAKKKLAVKTLTAMGIPFSVTPPTSMQCN